MSEIISSAPVSKVFASQLRRVREDVPLTAAELATRVTDLGVPMRREAVERIERGERQVQLDEAIACAAVLQTPLGVMCFGLGQLDEVGLSPEKMTHPDIWQQWLEGADSAPGVALDIKPFWKAQMNPVWIYQHLRGQQKEANQLRQRIDIAERAGITNVDAVAKFLAVCQDMAQTTEDMRAAGVRPPGWYPEFIAYVERLKDGYGG